MLLEESEMIIYLQKDTQISEIEGVVASVFHLQNGRNTLAARQGQERMEQVRE